MKKEKLESNPLVRDLLVESLSEDHVHILDSLKKPKHDEDISEELEVKATIIRTLLNDLHAANLVEYERTKNKKTGWYTYRWCRREEKVQQHVQDYLKKRLGALEQQLQDEEAGIAFTCGCQKLPYEEALTRNFVCESCNNAFEEYNSADVVDQITTEIAEINSLLEQT